MKLLAICAVEAEAEACRSCDSLHVVVSGVGRTNAALATTRSVLGSDSFDGVLSLGVAGALPEVEPALEIGAVVVATESIYHEEGIATPTGFQDMNALGFPLGDFEGNRIPGDEVLLPTPYWTTYPEPVALAGGVTVPIITTGEGGFRATVEQLEAARTENTKALVFVSPSNPTGAIYPRDEIKAIGRWAVEHDIWVICDEIYEHLVYGDNEHYSMATLVPELGDKVIILNGVAKTYAMTGWRVGWMIGPADLIKAAQNLQSHSTSNVANVAQAAALAAVTGPLDAVYEMREAFDRRRRTMHSLLSSIEGVLCPEPEGAFYAYPDFSALLGNEIGGRRIDTTLDLADILLEEAKVAIVPGEAFGVGGGARLSFALGDDDLSEGVGRIADFLS